MGLNSKHNPLLQRYNQCYYRHHKKCNGLNCECECHIEKQKLIALLTTPFNTPYPKPKSVFDQ